ncbi:hypothetical protein MMC21_008078 [Puttea exsequens]|nr:hypothetical protein [Puttea exsequens]
MHGQEESISTSDVLEAEYRPRIRRRDIVLRWTWKHLLEVGLKKVLNPIIFLETDNFVQELLEESFPTDERLADAASYKRDTNSVWLRIITEYTTKALTYEEDRLPAISGLARQLEPRLGKYYVGYWNGDLHGLLWYPAETTGQRPQSTHTPPTWS